LFTGFWSLATGLWQLVSCHWLPVSGSASSKKPAASSEKPKIKPSFVNYMRDATLDAFHPEIKQDSDDVCAEIFSYFAALCFFRRLFFTGDSVQA
jgi:hypothetical protein